MAKPAQVVAYCNPFDDQAKKITVPAGTSLDDVLRLLGIPATYKTKLWINGRAVERERKLKGGDACMVRVVPKDVSKTGTGPDPVSTGLSLGGVLKAAAPWAGAAVGVGALVSSLFFGKTAASKDAVNSAVTTPDPASNTADATVSAEQATLVPQVAGVSNQANPYGSLLCVFGENVRLFPVLGMNSYALLQGSDSYSYGCLDLGYGELDISDIRIGSRAISEFTDLQYEIQYGKASDAPFTIPLADVVETPLSVPLTYNTPKTARAGAAKTKLSIEIEFPNGLWDSNIFYPDIKEAFTVNFTIRYKLSTSSTWETTSYSVTDNVQTSRRYYYEWTPAAPGIYDIEITKTVGDTFPTGVYTAGAATCNWVSIKAWGETSNPFNPIYDAKGNQVYCARIAEKFKNTAEQQGALGDLNCLASRKIPHWNGTTFDAPAVSSHPPDIVLEILRGQANYAPVDDSAIDFDSFTAWSTYCTAKGWTYKKVIDQGLTTQALIDEVCAAGRAAMVTVNGKRTIIIDQPKPHVVQHFTQRTILKDSFSAQASLGKTPKKINAQFLNPDVDWQQDEIEVYDDGYDATMQDLETQTILFPGSTTTAQVHKRARYLMASTRLLFWTYIFRVATSHLACRIGDRIRVTHDAIFSGLGQARIVSLVTDGSGNITGINIDAAQEIQEGKNYAIYCMPNGLDEIHLPLSTAIGWQKTLTLTTPIPASDTNKPEADNQIQFGEIGFESRELLVTDITPSEDFTAQITAIDYNEDVFKADDGPIPAYTSKLSLKSPTIITVPVPTLYSVESGTNALVSLGGGAVSSSILFTLKPEALPVESFESQYKLHTGTTWSHPQLTPAQGGRVRISNVIDGQGYDVRIACRRGDNYLSDWLYAATNHVVVGKTQPPPDVPATVYRVPYSTVIAWFYDLAHGVTVPLDFGGFIVKMAWGSNRNWDQAVTLTTCQHTQYDIGGLAKGLKTIMIKAVDTSGNEQAGPPAYINLDFGDVLTENIVHTVPITSSYSDLTLTVAAWSGGTIQADDDGSLWWGDDLNADWWPEPLSGDWWDVSYKQATIEFSYLPPSTEPKPFRILLQGTYTGGYKIEYRLFGQSPWFEDPLDGSWWGADLSAAWWDESDPQWLPMPDDGIEGNWQRYDFRITLYGGSVRGSVTGLQVVIDVPDIVEYVNDFVVDNTAGKRVTLANSYRVIENVNITLEKNGSYPDAARAERLDKSITGPLIQVLDASNVGTTGIVDVIIKGY